MTYQMFVRVITFILRTYTTYGSAIFSSYENLLFHISKAWTVTVLLEERTKDSRLDRVLDGFGNVTDNAERFLTWLEAYHDYGMCDPTEYQEFISILMDSGAHITGANFALFVRESFAEPSMKL